jgi:hypothetical protein
MENQTPKPWDVEPGLKEEYLRIIAEILVRVRSEVAKRQQPAKGDSRYGLGCCTYERTKFTIIELVANRTYSWLSSFSGRSPIVPGKAVRSLSLDYAFAVGGCPMRIYRGDHENPPTRQLERAKDQLELFPDWRPRDGFLWFFVVETDSHGLAVRVVVMQANDAGEIRHPWTALEVSASIPSSDSSPAASPISSIAEVTDVPPPVVEPRLAPAKSK